MIQHIVLLHLRPDHDPQDLAAVMQGLSGLVGDIERFTAFTHGPNRDLEQKSARYPYGFVCTFTDTAAVQAYAIDPRHQALGARLVALCHGGADGIFVADIES